MEPYQAQQKKVEHIIKYLTPTFPILDTSKTGTGKTFTALWAAKQLGLKPFIVCPKSTISIWREAAEELDVELDDVVNYEKLRYGNHPRMWTKIVENRSRTKTYRNFYCKWTDPMPAIVIFDEAHKCSGMQSQLASFIIMSFNYHIPMLMLTATPGDSPLKLKAIGYAMRLHHLANFREWLESMGCRWIERRGWKFSRGKKGLDYMKWIHDTLVFQNKMIHITPNDIPSAMNDGILIPELRDIMDAKIIDNMFQNALDKIQFMEARRMCEKAKMEIFIEDGQELLDEGNSVIFFVNFHESVNLLRQAFPDAGVITGKDKNRDEVESNFQSDKIRTLICTSQAGGTSINLHDTNGLYPRVSLISPSFDANELIQVLGRTKRAGGKTPAIWKIIFAGGTVEERAYKTVKSKVKAIDTLTDGDLVTFEGIK